MSNLEILKILKEKKIQFKLIELSRPPKNAQDIVELFKCSLNQVIKTLLFVGDKNIIVCIPGDKQVNIDKLKKYYQVNKIRLAKLDEVLKLTGYPVGAVCPFNLPGELELIIDETCFLHDFVNVGAGTRTTGIEIKPSDLREIWKGSISDIL